MGFFIAKEASAFDKHEWKPASRVKYPTKTETKYAIISSFGFWNWYFGKYRVADCDHYPDKEIWLNGFNNFTQ